MVPAHWVTVRRHHTFVRVKRRAHRRLVTVQQCHARVVLRRIVVWDTVVRKGRAIRVKRHRIIRVVELPRLVFHSTRRIGHGKSTTVSGWLGMPDGTALAGQAVLVMTAADDGVGQFSEAALTTTASNGLWSTKLPAGPSRLVEAVYEGAATLEPSTSAQIRLLVPAKVRLISIWPPQVAWGGTIRIVGQLVGGFLPPGGALVRLRIGLGSSYTTYGVQEHVTGNGRFSTTYTFAVGDPRYVRSYWFQIASLPMGNYPYEPAASGKLTVVVGGHPQVVVVVGPPPTHRRHRRHRHRR
jgi:hypothetical protein